MAGPRRDIFLGYPKRIRLCARKEIDRVFRSGQYRRLGLLHARYLATDRSEPRFLVSVRRKVGKAHLRNRIRRLVKEAIRLNRPRLTRAFDICLFLTTAPENPSLSAFQSEVRRLFHDLNQQPARANEKAWEGS
jgi:ribonuclease P protein component